MARKIFTDESLQTFVDEIKAYVDGNVDETLLLKSVEVTLPDDIKWRATAYGGGKYVAISQTTTAAYSVDGIHWNTTTMPSGVTTWRAITYGNGMFVAIAHGSTAAAYSYDGITWKAATMPSNEYWYSIVYGEDKFVAIAGLSDTAAYSYDGITWHESPMPSSVNWYSVSYGNGVYVTVAYNTNNAAYSYDGINWTQVTLPSTTYWHTVAYGSGRFVAISYNTDISAYSYDGITWTQVTLPVSSAWRYIAYGNGVFVAVAENSTSVVYSIDGIIWNSTTLPYSQKWQHVYYGGGRFVVVGFDTDKIIFSNNGIEWSTQVEYLSDFYGEEVNLKVSQILGNYVNYDILANSLNLITVDDIDEICKLPPFTYTVDAIDGAAYGFALNDSGYYESQNKGVDNSYAICRVNLEVESICDITFNVINYAETSYDYGIFGNLDSALTLSNTADSNVKETFRNKQSPSIVNVTYSNVPAGNHFIDVKFIKDDSQWMYNDSVWFKIQ